MRNNKALNERIEQEINMWDGTIHGYQVKNAWENGTDYESMCEMIGEDYSDWEEE